MKHPAQSAYSVFGKHEKRLIIFMVSLGAFFSPLSGNIYYPALNVLSVDFRVSESLINLTITSYMIFQGLAPTVVASFSDTAGRRPSYVVCFILYIGANIGLALQTDYAALIVLRCIQSSGSSATGALSNAVIADITTSAERGSYVGYSFAVALLGQSFGPLIGGLLSQFLGWRAIFWFLTIFSAVFFIPFVAFVPETCRKVVGDGSIPPHGWNMSILNCIQQRKQSSLKKSPEPREQEGPPSQRRLQFPNPLSTLRIFLDLEATFLLLYSGLVFAGLASIAAALPLQFQEAYGFNALQIGLSCIPMGVGSCLAAVIMGQLANRNYRRHALRCGLPVEVTRQQDLSGFPIEAARLELSLPMLYLGCATFIAYGWVLHFSKPLAGPLILLFVNGFAITGAFNVMSTLLIDIYPESPATAMAASNLVRCLLGAGAAAVVIPMQNKIGKGWTFTFVGLLLFVLSPTLWIVMKRGPRWREQKGLRDKETKDNDGIVNEEVNSHVRVDGADTEHAQEK
ncbi:MAG: hypothetical protein M1837_002696 [Sclerophora amabilis]|nr:MAG: hypothetical protein M1837_002696 [Sclerophora amabilis]